MSKQNRLLMTNKTDYMTQEDHEAYDQELEKIDLKNMVETIEKRLTKQYPEFAP